MRRDQPAFELHHGLPEEEGEARHPRWKRWIGIGVVFAMVLPVIVSVYAAVFDR